MLADDSVTLPNDFVAALLGDHIEQATILLEDKRTREGDGASLQLAAVVLASWSTRPHEPAALWETLPGSLRRTPDGEGCQGLLLLDGGQCDAALDRLAAALVSPTSSELLWRLALARALLAVGRTVEAKAEALHVVAVAPSAGGAWFTAGRCAEAEGQWEDALHAYATAHQSNPHHLHACAAEVQLALQLGRTEHAAAALARGLRFAPDDVDLLRLHVQVTLAQGEEGRALEGLRALGKGAWAPEELLSLGMLALENEMLDIAERFARDAGAAAPRDWRGHYLLGRVMEASGAPREIIFGAYEAALDVGDLEGEAGARLGVLLLEGPLADPELALEVLGAARDRNPHHGGILLHLAFAHVSCGERDEALACLDALPEHVSLSDLERSEAENLRALLTPRDDA